MIRFVLALALAVLLVGASVADAKPRTIITTDGEVDDIDSMARWFLYANEMDTVGLVYSSSQWHWKGDGKGTLFTSPTNSARYGTRTDLRWVGETWIQEQIDLYAASYDTLKQHAPGYPTPDHLRPGARRQHRVRGRDGEGHARLGPDQAGAARRRPVAGLPADLGRHEHGRAGAEVDRGPVKGTPAWDAIYDKVSQARP